jgi:N-acetylmuramoyl-L-alanine amidase
MILLLTVFININITPMHAAQASNMEDRLTLQPAQGYNEQQALQNQATPYLPAAVPSRGSISRASQDIDYLAHTIYGEARGEPYEGKVAIAAVVLNRLESGRYGNSISEVIFQPGAFTAARDGQYYLQPDDSCYEAAAEALNGWDPTGGAIYYWNPDIATDDWVHTRTVIKTIGNHVFAQ